MGTAGPDIPLLDGDDQQAAYWLGRPMRSGDPTDQWQAGEIVRDPWDVAVPAEVNPGDYRLDLVLFDIASGQAVGGVDLGSVVVKE